MRLFFETKMIDYRSEAEARVHAKQMKKWGWSIKDQYPQDDGEYHWTVEYMKQH